MRSYWERERPIEMRPVDVSRYFSREPRPPEQYIWMRASGPLPPDDLPLHQCVLAYASDFSLLDTTLIAHGKLMFDRDVQLASLDHALWLHRPFRADEWLLYAQDSPSSHGARGFCRGRFFTRDGTLIAMYRHRAHADVLARVGLQDLTAFVDFSALAEAGRGAGFRLAGMGTQSDFLMANGLDQVFAEAYAAAADETARYRLSQEVKRLTLPSEMGETFKVMAFER